eukprot:TRINITY_DN9362_c0_g1_i1.p1 TRINITY_DN9362_c0_g1~~TRINITY_DN9362_c0_g1_i1.p1  ORF type:complete len:1562 (-),score=383.80 TRINITY_DN9362_c0_g1_i1:33-4718(-)
MLSPTGNQFVNGQANYGQWWAAHQLLQQSLQAQASPQTPLTPGNDFVVHFGGDSDQLASTPRRPPGKKRGRKKKSQERDSEENSDEDFNPTKRRETVERRASTRVSKPRNYGETDDLDFLDEPAEEVREDFSIAIERIQDDRSVEGNYYVRVFENGTEEEVPEIDPTTPIDKLPEQLTDVKGVAKYELRTRKIQEYLVKWKGSAHIHNSWVAEDVLKNVRGYKRLQNYQKKQRERDYMMQRATPEELEQFVIEREMQQGIMQQWVLAERIFDERFIPLEEANESPVSATQDTFRAEQELRRQQYEMQRKTSEHQFADEASRLRHDFEMQLMSLQVSEQQNQHLLRTSVVQQQYAMQGQDPQELMRLNSYMMQQQTHLAQQYHTQRAMLQMQHQEQHNQLRQQHMQHQQALRQQFQDVQDFSLSSSRAARYATEVLVKWKALPYAESTWEKIEEIAEKFQPELDEYRRFRDKQGYLPNPNVPREPDQFNMLTTQPSYLMGGDLRDYQLTGLNWLAHNWANNVNGILADEMGLGKTIQTISFISYMVKEKGLPGPYLMIVPLSTLEQWIAEFKRWSPYLYVVPYIGDAKSREIIREHEFYWQPSNSVVAQPAGTVRRRRQQRLKAHVVLTTYELVVKDASELRRLPWCFLGVDEAHHLKNSETKLYQELSQFECGDFRLLVTGTPLQNSFKELWCLLHFLMPKRFPSCEDFERKYSIKPAEGDDAATREQNEIKIGNLHKELQPHILRRLKTDVEKSLPKKIERILRVSLSPLQRRYSRWILTRNFGELNKGGNTTSLLNIVVELKKVSNHPYLFDGAEQTFLSYGKPKDALKALVLASGKMVLLDKLLAKLKETKHRVLIFSQMVRVLDILSDYLRLRGHTFQRLDGSTGRLARQASVDHFNDPGSNDFCFLLSTRAGGLGLNLTGADTVILFDSDWNPQNDLQAEARVHRIGQKKTVNIYRFVTKESIEESILERSKRKMVLSHLVVQGMDTSGYTILNKLDSSASKFDKDELQEILKFGAEKLFKDSNGNYTDNPDELEDLDDEATMHLDIDDVLSRAEERTDADESREGGADEFLNSFKVVHFNTFQNKKPKPRKKKEELDPFWSQLISEAARIQHQNPFKPKARGATGSASGSGDASGHKRATTAGGTASKRRVALQPLKKVLGNDEARAVVQHLRFYPELCNMAKALAAGCIKGLTKTSPKASLLLAQEVLQKCSAEVQQASAAQRPPEPVVVLGTKADPGAIELKRRQITIFHHHIARQSEAHPEHNFVFSFRMSYSTSSYSHKNCPSEWGPDHDRALLTGVWRHGFGNWEAIRQDPALGLSSLISPSTAADSAPSAMNPKQLQNRVDLLLRMLHEDFLEQERQGHAPFIEAEDEQPDWDLLESIDPREGDLAVAAAQEGSAQQSQEDTAAVEQAEAAPARFIPKPEVEELCQEYFDDYEEELAEFSRLATYTGPDKAEKVRKVVFVVGQAVEAIVDKFRADWSTQCTEETLLQHLWHVLQQRTKAKASAEDLRRLYNILVETAKAEGEKNKTQRGRATPRKKRPKREDAIDEQQA